MALSKRLLRRLRLSFPFAMKTSLVWISVVVLGMACGCRRQAEVPLVPVNAYIPTGLLRDFGETPLAAEPNKHIYRFICSRTFHEPFCIVVRVNPDGTGGLTKKMLGGKGGYARGAMKENAEVSLTASQVENLLGLLEQEQFWTLPPGEAENAIGQDGSSWVIEGVRTNHYHIAERWTPKADTPVGRIGRHMIELADWKIGDLY